MARELDIAWAAGVFEGEGSISISNAYGAPASRLRVGMTDLDVIQRLQSVMEAGRVYGPSGSPTKPMWTWQVHRGAEVQRVIEAFMPFLGKRRTARANELLAWLAGCPGRGHRRTVAA